jgi:hypothetical protein
MPYAWNPKQNNWNPERNTGNWFTDNAAFATDFMEEVASSPVCVRVGGDKLDQIVDDGRFKTLSEIPQLESDARGTEYRDWRSRLENDTWGIPQKEEAVYGYLDTNKPQYTKSIHNYGDVQITLKDSIKGRTTLTGGDSLTSALTPVRVSDLQSRSASGEQMTAAITYSGGYYLSRGEMPTFDYFEAQIHGGVTLNDIKSVSLLGSSKVKSSTLDALKSRGIEVTVRDGNK